jgi:uncharacterized protein
MEPGQMHYPLLIVALLVLFSGNAMAEADGPDYYQVRDVSSSDTLNIRAEPHADAARLGEIQPDGVCIRNLGCQGGLTFQEFTTLSKAQQAQRLKDNPRWCKVEYQGLVGWVAGRYLAEGSCTQDSAQSHEVGPSFDCAKAGWSVEELICNDADLAALDRQMAAVYAAALKRVTEDSYEDPAPVQRGWIKGRNDCWKSDNLRACIESSYKNRIAELQIQYGQLVVPSPVYYSCGKTDLTAVFYQQTNPQTVVLTFIPALTGVDQMLAYHSPSGSGARYEGRNVSFREHHGEAKLTWFDQEMSCKVRENSVSE